MKAKGHLAVITAPAVSDFGLSLRALFLLLSVTILITFQGEPWLRALTLIFVSIVLEALPFMLLGSMVSGFVEIFLSRERLAAFLPRKRFLLTLAAAGLGVLFPVCECAVVPVVRRFLRKGIPLSAAIAYLLAGPIFNPVVGASTAVAYAASPGWQTFSIVAIRLGSGFIIAVMVGWIMGRLFTGREALAEPMQDDLGERRANQGEEESSLARCSTDRPNREGPGRRILSACNHGIDDFLDITQFLVLGAFIASLLQILVTRQAFLDIAGSPLVSMPIMMGLAVLLNLCSEADAFIAASFRTVLPLSSQMAFMVLGPMLDIKLILMYLGVFKKKTIVTLACLVLAAVFLVMLLLHFGAGDWYNLPAGGLEAGIIPSKE
ncbi:MAG: permease [Planctomycetota bacterium]